MSAWRLEAVADLHMHTPRCNHATGSPSAYAEQALARGLSEIGFSEHAPMAGGFDAAWRMRPEEVHAYAEEVRALAAQYAGRLTIRLGIECDWRPEERAHLAELLQSEPWDYAIGSVHFLGDWGFDNPEEIDGWNQRDVEEVFLAYYARLKEAAESGLFDLLAHPDLVKKFGHRADTPRVRKAILDALDAIAKHDLALEVSSAGLRKPVGEVYPSSFIVAEAARRGIAFCYGSDAHAPSEVGHGMDACLSLLAEHGITTIASFEKRRRILRRFR